MKELDMKINFKFSKSNFNPMDDAYEFIYDNFSEGEIKSLENQISKSYRELSSYITVNDVINFYQNLGFNLHFDEVYYQEVSSERGYFVIDFKENVAVFVREHINLNLF